MKKKTALLILLIFTMVMGNAVFADAAFEDLPLGEKQELLFVVQGPPLEGLCAISSFTYDLEQKTVVPLYSKEQEVQQDNLSPDGTERVYVDTEIVDEETGLRTAFFVFQKIDSEDYRRVQISADHFYKTHNLYTTEKYIILAYGDTERMSRIERYSYEGDLKGSVIINERSSACMEGPGGSTLYLQKSNPDRKVGEDQCDDPVELIQINWEPKNKTSYGSGPRPVIREQTRAGHTVARFTNSQFGLLRVEEPETGIVDYSAPIRSTENLVKLQIPYCDIQAKLESGARNLLVEVQGQTLTFPMDLFACDDMLAAMPCQTDATIEIIMHTDEAGKVAYEVQLFVVEQVNGMTRVVHRKTIQ